MYFVDNPGLSQKQCEALAAVRQNQARQNSQTACVAQIVDIHILADHSEFLSGGLGGNRWWQQAGHSLPFDLAKQEGVSWLQLIGLWVRVGQDGSPSLVQG